MYYQNQHLLNILSFSLPVPSDDNELNPTKANNDKTADAYGEEEACELLSETSVEVPIVYEADGSQKSFSVLHEELADESKSKRSLAGKGNMAGKQQPAKKLTRYNRKGRGRGGM